MWTGLRAYFVIIYVYIYTNIHMRVCAHVCIDLLIDWFIYTYIFKQVPCSLFQESQPDDTASPEVPWGLKREPWAGRGRGSTRGNCSCCCTSEGWISLKQRTACPTQQHTAVTRWSWFFQWRQVACALLISCILIQSYNVWCCVLLTVAMHGVKNFQQYFI